MDETILFPLMLSLLPDIGWIAFWGQSSSIAITESCKPPKGYAKNMKRKQSNGLPDLRAFWRNAVQKHNQRFNCFNYGRLAVSRQELRATSTEWNNVRFSLKEGPRNSAFSLTWRAVAVLLKLQTAIMCLASIRLSNYVHTLGARPLDEATSRAVWWRD